MALGLASRSWRFERDPQVGRGLKPSFRGLTQAAADQPIEFARRYDEGALNDLIEECAAFPNGAHDDQVDAMTQALLRWNMVPYQQAVTYRELPEISPI